MSEENKNKSHRGQFIVMAVAIAVPLLYVLSFGPAAVIVDKFPNPKLVSAYEAFYLPLLWLSEHNMPFRILMLRYIELLIGQY